MKTIRIISFVFSILILSGLSSVAQVITAESNSRATAKIMGTLVSPVGIIKIRDMSFVTIVSGNDGSFEEYPDGSFQHGPKNPIEFLYTGSLQANQVERFPLTTGEVAFQTTNSASTSAILEVSDGMNNNSSVQNFYTGYSVSLPSQDVTLVGESGRRMRVSNFTSSHSASGLENFPVGKEILRIGATLYIEPYLGNGKYVSVAPFLVTVNFY